jgi:hypothetical protein
MDERDSREDGGDGSQDGVTEREVGQATIVYENPDGGQVSVQVDNDGIAYFQDHWIVRTGETDEGHDTVRRIPSHRVYYVERDVEEFKQEVQSLRNQVESLASEVKSRFSSGESDEDRGRDDRFDDQDAW